MASATSIVLNPLRPASALRIAPGWVIAALVAAATVGFAPNTYWLYLIGLTAVYTIVGAGLNLLTGLSGQVSIGHAGFFAAGAYVTAILTTRYGISFWWTLPLAMLLPALLGALLAAPALRVKGPYLAMVTIAFGLVLQNILIEAEPVTGGFNGITDIAKPGLGTFGGALSLRAHVALAVVCAGLSLLTFSLLRRHRFGKRLRAVRDSEIAARSIGLDAWRVKTAAFVVSAAAAGLAGSLFAPLAGFISPDNFDMALSIQFLLLIILGGLEADAGPLIGAIVIAALPEALSAIAEYRLLFFGCLLLLILAVMPDGVAGALARVAAAAGIGLRKQKAAAAVDAAGSNAAAARATAWLQRDATTTALAAERIGITFGGIRAVDAVSFVARGGDVTGLIGPNGAGKTSVLNMLGGFYKADAGTVRLGDTALAPGRSQECARAGIGRTFQTTLLFGSLTVADNIVLALGSAGHAHRTVPGSDRTPQQDALQRVHDLLALVGFRGDPDTPAQALPFVDRRLVEIARALALRPAALLLDEPAAGLGAVDKAALADTLQRIAGCGIAVVVVEHDMPLIMRACTALVAMESGRVLRAGSVADVRTDPAVLAAYLGTGAALVRGQRQPAGEELLATDALCAGYGPIAVLREVSLQVRAHELVAVVGANGAGKSTLMRALTGLLPSTGSVRLNGAPLPRHAEAIARAGLVMVPEGRQVFPGLSVRDNLLLGGYGSDAATRQRNLAAMLARFPRLNERLQQPAVLLSGGEQQMLAIARGLMAMPRILILDEPSLGLAPQVVQGVYETIDALVADGLTVLLVDQFAAMALAIADRGYLLAQGEVAGEGDADVLLQDPSIRHAYLGTPA